jgi:hypothetical protein
MNVVGNPVTTSGKDSMFGRMIDRTLHTSMVGRSYVWCTPVGRSTLHHTFEHLCSTVHSIKGSINGSL